MKARIDQWITALSKTNTSSVYDELNVPTETELNEMKKLLPTYYKYYSVFNNISDNEKEKIIKAIFEIDNKLDGVKFEIMRK